MRLIRQSMMISLLFAKFLSFYFFYFHQFLYHRVWFQRTLFILFHKGTTFMFAVQVCGGIIYSLWYIQEHCCPLKLLSALWNNWNIVSYRVFWVNGLDFVPLQTKWIAYLWGTANPQHVTYWHNASQRYLQQNYIQIWQRTKRFRWT